MRGYHEVPRSIRSTRYCVTEKRVIGLFIGILLLASILPPQTLRAETPAERLMLATFKIFNPGSTATGFLVRDPSPDAARTNVLLVTTGHTFAKAQGDHILLVCRARDAQGAWQRIDHKIVIRSPTNAPLWVCHATQDVAVLRCTLPPQAVFEALPLDALADAPALADHGVSIGTPLFFLGYPNRTEANSAAFPLLREGVVSGYPITPAKTYPTFFFSAHTFAGDSGAPVALRSAGNDPPLVVGIVITRTQQNDRLTSPEWDMTFKRDMGLGSLLHAAYIRDTIGLLK